MDNSERVAYWVDDVRKNFDGMRWARWIGGFRIVFLQAANEGFVTVISVSCSSSV